MTSSPPLDGPTRRRVLIGAGAAIAAPAVLGLADAAAADDPAPECLASLVQEGELTYGDLMAG